jgi:hypothetical protein
LFLLLMSAGFGSSPQVIGKKLTWRQIQHFAGVLRRQQRHKHADMIQAVALGMGAKDLSKVLRELRA